MISLLKVVVAKLSITIPTYAFVIVVSIMTIHTDICMSFL